VNVKNTGSLAASIAGISSAVVVAVACGGKSPPPSQPLTNETVEPTAGGGAAAEPGVPAGVTDGALWTCQIGDYDPQPCKFHREGNEWHLSKLMGSQRFTGVTTFDGAQMHFVGQFFCPWGSCDEAMDVQLVRGDNGAYAADFGGDIVTVQWSAELAAEWGGAGYGNRTGREVE
jgi:hypothetical protein